MRPMPVQNTFSPSFRIPWSVGALILLAVSLLFVESTWAQAESTEPPVSVGIGSVSKLGKWLPVRIDVDADQGRPANFEVSALDSEATKATFRGPVTAVNEAEGIYEAWVRLGRAYGTLGVQLTDAQGKVVCNREVNVSSLDPRVSTSSHMLVIGGNDDLHGMLVAIQETLQVGRPHEVIQLSDAEELPTQWMGYDSIESVFLSTANLEQLSAVSETQWQALEEWVARGGRVYVSANGTRGQLDEGAGLSRFLVGEYRGVTELKSMVRLDSYAKSRLDAKALKIADLDVKVGLVELANEGTPLVVRQLQGVGQVLFMTLDVMDAELKDWKGRSALLAQFLDAKEVKDINRKPDRGGARVSHHGFKDLSGQLKIPLEDFSQVQMINFTVVAVLIGLYVLCIGPGDFFFLKKVTGKMEMTWISFTLVTLLFGGLAYWLSGWAKPAEIQVNQLEIVDVDAATGRVRGNAWINVFSPRTGQHQVDFELTEQLRTKKTSQLMSWLGIPGQGLGGMQTKAGLVKGQSGYEVLMEPGDQGASSTLNQMPFQVASTRGFHTEWSGKFEEKIQSRLEFSNSRLIGQVTNPFPFELKNVRVMYGNYTYILPNTLPAGATLDIGGETQERTGKSYLTRRSKSAEKKDRGQNMPWDLTSSRMDRIADMMMFYEIAGGQDYTSLTHLYQNRVEMSDLVNYDQAIFVGEVGTRSGEILVDGKSASDHYDRQLSIFRILLPVD